MAYNGNMKTQLRLTKENQKTFGVPASVHAQAQEIAKREHVALWKVVSKALTMYAAYTANNGNDQDGSAQ